MGSPLNLPVSGVTDALGNASANLYGFTPRLFAAWNLQLSVPGNAPSVTVMQAGQLVGSAQVIAGVANVGPIATAPGVPVGVNITGALPSSPFSGVATGIEAQTPADPDLAAMTGMTSGNVGTIAPFDGPTLLAEAGVSHGGDGPLTAVLAVQNWASVLLGVRMNQLTGSCTGALVTFRWYAEPTGSRLVGQRAMMIDLTVPTLVATIPNLGPYLQVVANRLGPGGGTYNWNASLLASNRLVPDVFGGNFNPYLVEQYNQTMGASSSTDYPFGTVYGGPIHMAFSNSGGSPGQITVRLLTLGSDGTYHAGLAFSDTVPASVTGQDSEIIVPPVPCGIRVVSAPAAGTYTYSVLVYSSATGAT